MDISHMFNGKPTKDGERPWEKLQEDKNLPLMVPMQCVALLDWYGC